MNASTGGLSQWSGASSRCSSRGKAPADDEWIDAHSSKSGQEIYDLAWSPDGRFILAGSIDHTASIYDVATGA